MHSFIKIILINYLINYIYIYIYAFDDHDSLRLSITILMIQLIFLFQVFEINNSSLFSFFILLFFHLLSQLI